jgi:hypothetical protein
MSGKIDFRQDFPFHPIRRYNAVAQTTPSGVSYMSQEVRLPRKTDTLNLRVAPETKSALREIGRRENRSMVNALEWLVSEYFRARGIAPPEQNENGK